jgi:hypothetical protein
MFTSRGHCRRYRQPASSAPRVELTLMPDPAPKELEIVACPECGLPAEVVDRVVVASTAGPVNLIRTMCVRRHWYMMANSWRPLRVYQPPLTVRHRGAGG